MTGYSGLDVGRQDGDAVATAEAAAAADGSAKLLRPIRMLLRQVNAEAAHGKVMPQKPDGRPPWAGSSSDIGSESGSTS